VSNQPVQMQQCCTAFISPPAAAEFSSNSQRPGSRLLKGRCSITQSSQHLPFKSLTAPRVCTCHAPLAILLVHGSHHIGSPLLERDGPHKGGLAPEAPRSQGGIQLGAVTRGEQRDGLARLAIKEEPLVVKATHVGLQSKRGGARAGLVVVLASWMGREAEARRVHALAA